MTIPSRLALGNGRRWAVLGALRAVSRLTPVAKHSAVEPDVEELSEGWTRTMEAAVRRAKAIVQEVLRGDALGVAVQPGVAFMPYDRAPRLVVVAVSLVKEGLSLGFATGPPVPVEPKPLPLSFGLLRLASSATSDEPLNEAVLELTGGLVSLSDMVAEAVECSLVSLLVCLRRSSCEGLEDLERALQELGLGKL